MSGKTWTVFGMGFLIWDVFEAIASNGDAVSQVILNTEVNPAILERVPPDVRIARLEDFTPATEGYCFGFVDPRKQPLLDRLEAFHLPFANVVHRFSWISPAARLGRGNFIGAGAVLAPNVELGEFNFINRCASVGHDTRIGRLNHVGPGATVAGRCTIGDRNFLGAGSVVIDGIRIRDGVTLGAGATAVKDLLEPGTYVGTPAVKLGTIA